MAYHLITLLVPLLIGLLASGGAGAMSKQYKEKALSLATNQIKALQTDYVTETPIIPMTFKIPFNAILGSWT